MLCFPAACRRIHPSIASLATRWHAINPQREAISVARSARLCCYASSQYPRRRLCVSPQVQQTRTLAAFGKHWKESAAQHRKRKKRARQHIAENKRKQQQQEQVDGDKSSLVIPPAQDEFSQAAPPAFFRVTDSPHVFIASSSPLEEETKSSIRRGANLSGIDKSNYYFDYLGSKPPSGKDRVFEVAFLGRSNVGKSSLLNAIFMSCSAKAGSSSKKLARTSKQPGRTQRAHYFGWYWQKKNHNAGDADELLGILIDLPGYGFAVGPDAAVDDWQRRTQNLLARRGSGNSSLDSAALDSDNKPLKNVYVLVDARHGATPFDWSVMAWLKRNEIPYSVVITKADGTTRPVLIKHLNEICMRLCHQWQEEQRNSSEPQISGTEPIVHITSAKDRSGIDDLLFASVAKHLGGE